MQSERLAALCPCFVCRLVSRCFLVSDCSLLQGRIAGRYEHTLLCTVRGSLLQLFDTRHKAKRRTHFSGDSCQDCHGSRRRGESASLTHFSSSPQRRCSGAQCVNVSVSFVSDHPQRAAFVGLSYGAAGLASVCKLPGKQACAVASEQFVGRAKHRSGGSAITLSLPDCTFCSRRFHSSVSASLAVIMYMSL